MNHNISLLPSISLCLYLSVSLSHTHTHTHTHTRVHVKLMKSVDCSNINVLVLYKMLPLRKTKGTQELSELFLQLPMNL